MMYYMHGHLPSFGVKRDAVPGRINETWFKAEKEEHTMANAQNFVESNMLLCQSLSK